MTTWFVTRHPGALQWAKDNGIEVDDRTICSDLDIGVVHAGDLVVGTLPVHLVAELNERGARYLHLSLKVPEGARGRELSAEEMCRFGARLEEYRVAPLGTFPSSTVVAGGGEVVICVASNQPLANLLPLFMRRPRAIHVVETRDQAARRTSKRLQAIAGRLGLPCRVSGDTQSAPLQKVKIFGARLIAELRAEHPGARIVLNATGGTKLMSLGLTSQVGPLGEVIYCDTEHDRIEVISPEGREASPIPPDLINLRLLLMSQGIDVISAESDSEDWMARARTRIKLSRKLARLQSRWALGTLNWIATKAAPKRRGKNVEAFAPEQELGGFAEGSHRIIDDIAEFAVWERKGADRVVFRDEDAVRYLKGGWLEELAAVEMEALCQDAGIPKGHWAAGLKVRPENASPAPNLPLNELDLVVVWRNRLLIVECKTGMQAGDTNESMNIANKLKAIRDYLGGPFSSMWLASAQQIPPDSMAAERCRLAEVQIVHHLRLNELRNFFAGWMRLGESHGARTDWASSPRRNR